jgi:hypothetical protein
MATQAIEKTVTFDESAPLSGRHATSISNIESPPAGVVTNRVYSSCRSTADM